MENMKTTQGTIAKMNEHFGAEITDLKVDGKMITFRYGVNFRGFLGDKVQVHEYTKNGLQKTVASLLLEKLLN